MRAIDILKTDGSDGISESDLKNLHCVMCSFLNFSWLHPAPWRNIELNSYLINIGDDLHLKELPNHLQENCLLPATFNGLLKLSRSNFQYAVAKLLFISSDIMRNQLIAAILVALNHRAYLIERFHIEILANFCTQLNILLPSKIDSLFQLSTKVAALNEVMDHLIFHLTSDRGLEFLQSRFKSSDRGFTDFCEFVNSLSLNPKLHLHPELLAPCLIEFAAERAATTSQYLKPLTQICKLFTGFYFMSESIYPGDPKSLSLRKLNRSLLMVSYELSFTPHHEGGRMYSFRKCTHKRPNCLIMDENRHIGIITALSCFSMLLDCEHSTKVISKSCILPMLGLIRQSLHGKKIASIKNC